MVLSNFQGSFNGLTFGPGTDIQLVSIDGLRALPSVRGGDQAKPRLDGSYGGLNFLSERTVTLKLSVTVTQTPFETVIANVANAFQSINSPTALLPFQFMMPGWANPKQLVCRPSKADISVDLNYSFHKADSIQIELSAPDPLIYDTVQQTASSGLPSPLAGLTFPVTYDVAFGASTGGSLQVTNSGNYSAPVVFTITGPCTNPVVSLGAQFMKLNLTLATTDQLVIDMGQRTVSLNGASRSNKIVTGSSWFLIPPGMSSVGVGSSDSAAVAATFTASWASAWGWI